MPAHVKAALLGPSLTLPVPDGRLALGTWQGIYLCEQRDPGGARVARGDAVGRVTRPQRCADRGYRRPDTAGTHSRGATCRTTWSWAPGPPAACWPPA